MNEAEIREKLRKVEALFARAGSEGEQLAAKAAAERIRARLASAQVAAPPIEMKFSLGNAWSRQLFVALCRRYGLKPFRYARQRHTTVMLYVPEPFVNDVLWPEFQHLDSLLTSYLSDVTQRIIRDEVFADTNDAEEIAEPRRLAP